MVADGIGCETERGAEETDSTEPEADRRPQAIASSAHAAAPVAATAMRAGAVLHAQKGSGPPPGDAMDPA